MKKIIAVLSVICMLLCGGVVLAEEPQSCQNSQLEYTYEGTYYVNIPQEIKVGNTFEITANLNIMDDKEVTVSFGEFEHRDRIKLVNSVSNDTVDVQFTKPDGTVYYNDDNVIATFNNDTQYMSYAVGTIVEYDNGIKAGSYIGNVDFLISCHDKSQQ